LLEREGGNVCSRLVRKKSGIMRNLKHQDGEILFLGVRKATVSELHVNCVGAHEFHTWDPRSKKGALMGAGVKGNMGIPNC